MRIGSRTKWLLGVCLALAVVGVAVYNATTSPMLSPATLRMATGVGAKLACSGVYLMGREPEEVIARDLRPFIPPLLEKVDFQFDSERQIASASIWGLFRREALFRPGLGCTLMLETDRQALVEQAAGIDEGDHPSRGGLWPAGDGVGIDRSAEDIDWQQLDLAMEDAFADPTGAQSIDTRALIVVHRGRIVAERYAPGFDENDRFLAWSASKSITSALLGTLVSDGKLELDAPAPIKAWWGEGDPRGDITLRHLLTMTDGLDFGEHPYGPGNDSTNMLFFNPDMSAYAGAKPLAHPPGSHWSYSSGTTNLLSQILFDAVGANLPALHRYIWQRFFGPLGMDSAVFEVDVSGSQVGSSYFYATARDMARFGLLFLNRGHYNGRQVLSEDWVEFSVTPIDQAPLRQYGAQFWLNAGDPQDPANRMFPDCPPDLFVASGFNGQHIAMVPSKEALVMRLGWTNHPQGYPTSRHFGAILRALPESE